MANGIINTAARRSELLCPKLGTDAITRRLARIDDPNVAPLNDWVRSIRGRGVLPDASAETIPWFDPDSGGIDARALLLLQDPSRTAAETEFVSPDNNDQTAWCTTQACDDAGLARDLRLHWNVYPWWVNVPGAGKTKSGQVPDPTRPAESWATARPIAARLTGELMGLLPRLRVIVVLGVEANRGFDAVVGAGLHLSPDVLVIPGPSLSPPGFHKHRAKAVGVLRQAAMAAGGGL